jgi:hypothetical protein
MKKGSRGLLEASTGWTSPAPAGRRETGKAGELRKDFSSALLDAARSKINCQVYSGRIAGYGKVWLD